MADKELLRMAKELDEMTRSVTTEEAEILDGALKAMKAKRTVPGDVAQAIRKMHDQYLGASEAAQTDQETEETPDEDLEQE